MPPCPASFVFSVETGFLHVGQAGLELPTSGDLPASASQNVGITGLSYHTGPKLSKSLTMCINEHNEDNSRIDSLISKAKRIRGN